MLLLSRFTISGHSMEPTIINGQAVLVSGLLYLFSRPKIGDIIAFSKKPAFAKASASKEKIFIKRIVKINQEKYFVRGDNKKDSMDSKDFGWIGKGKIIGKVILT